jgi:KUP system potassium uptake protein
METGSRGFLVLGAVFLVVTGAEALYADMGHFGKRPIRAAWFVLVFPALLLNYFGQGAMLLGDPTAAVNPFYRLAPPWAMYPLVALSTAATIIASQAIISGAFSLTRQATMLGYWPRLQIAHTSPEEIGQIYVPTINWLLMFAAIGLVVGFESSSNLAAAYGIAVSMTMVITTLLAYVVAHDVWGWNRLAAALVSGVFLVPDLAFFGANAVKIEHGGWFPLLVGGLLFLLMNTWKRGRAILRDHIRTRIVPLSTFFEIMHRRATVRVPGAAVFMTSNPEGTPPALMYNFLHNHVVHEQVVLLTIRTEEVARVADRDRVTTETFADGFLRIVAHYGFMEEPDIPALLARDDTPSPPMEETTFFLGRETLIAEGQQGMSRWRERLFALMSRNAERAMSYFRLPPERVMEVGSQIRL